MWQSDGISPISDFMEMMMMQNAQMHHMIMQQMMVNTLPGNRNTLPPVVNDGQLVAVQVGII